MLRLTILNDAVNHNVAVLISQISRHEEKNELEIKQRLKGRIDLESGLFALGKPTNHIDIYHLELMRTDKNAYFIFSQPLHLLSEEGQEVVKKTIKILNEVIGSAPHAVSQTLSDIELAPHHPNIARAWYPYNRIEAEKVLLGCKVGTYLFRNDPFALELQEDLMEIFPLQIVECTVVTLKSEADKIEEKILIRKGDEWTLFDDNLMLDLPFYPSLQALFQALPQFETPFFS